ncbi:VTT domain-containing protein [Massilia sp. GCM10023247]|uniref:VTT domain-containing protein n=1 Tax=Massilia sp. GCM10023247 TaxID=3252643 RepID=UPI003610DCDE
MLTTLLEWFLHLDRHLTVIATEYQFLVYVLLFAVIFVETGVVVMPFLPGDSLLFVTGALAAKGLLALPMLIPLLILAAVLGDILNFAIGSAFRNRVKNGYRLRFIKPEHIAHTERFFERHGPKTIVLARYVPIVRTLAPFVAALGSMRYRTFLSYNVAGGTLWVVSLTVAGYIFGNIKWVNDNLTAVILGIIVLSLVPGIVAWLRERSRSVGTGPQA